MGKGRKVVVNKVIKREGKGDLRQKGREGKGLNKGKQRKGVSACRVLTSSNLSYKQKHMKALSSVGRTNGEDAHYPLPYR